MERERNNFFCHFFWRGSRIVEVNWKTFCNKFVMDYACFCFAEENFANNQINFLLRSIKRTLIKYAVCTHKYQFVPKKGAKKNEKKKKL